MKTERFRSRRPSVSLGGVAFLILALAAAAPVSGEVSAPMDARKVVEAALMQVLSILADRERPIEVRRGELEKVTLEQFDFEVVSRLALGRNWKRLSESQQAQFVDQFRSYLAESYGTRLDRYGQESVEVVGDRAEPRGDVTVQTRVVGGQYDGISIDYRMRLRGDRWRAIDVVIEGVSLVSSYRSQFAEVMSGGGPDALLKQLADRNATQKVSH